MQLFLPDIGVIVAIFFALAVAAFWDWNCGFIPITVFPFLLFGVLPVTFLVGGPAILDSVFGAATAFAAYIAMAVWFKGGGGDVLMMTVLGWCLGLKGVMVLIFITSGLYLVFTVIMSIVLKIRKKPVKILYRQYPYAPFVLVGFTLYILAAWNL